MKMAELRLSHGVNLQSYYKIKAFFTFFLGITGWRPDRAKGLKNFQNAEKTGFFEREWSKRSHLLNKSS